LVLRFEAPNIKRLHDIQDFIAEWLYHKNIISSKKLY